MLFLMRHVQEKAASDFSLVALKSILILIGVALIVLALLVNNKWVLGGAIAWVFLP